MSIVKRQKEEKNEAAKKKKKQEDAEKAERKAKKQRKATEEIEKFGPILKDHVEKGLEHVLSLQLSVRRDILRIHFGRSTVEIDGKDIPIYRTTKAQTETALRDLLIASSMPTIPSIDKLESSIEAIDEYASDDNVASM